jgi:apolipoprotein N-acyltransferase
MQFNTLIKILGLMGAGALFPFSLAPYSIWPAAIFSMATLFYALGNQTPKRAFWIATLFGMGMFGVGTSWVFVSMHSFGDVSIQFAIVGTVLFCLLNATVFAIPFSLSASFPDKRYALLLGLPALWVISEWIRSWLFTGFPWLFAGYSHTETWLNGWAPIGGIYLISYFCGAIAALLAQALSHPSKKANIISIFIVGALFLGGYFLQKVNWTEPTGKSLSVALVQPNIDQSDKWSLSMRNQILEQLVIQTQPYWGTDIILWPEGAIPAIYTQVTPFLGKLHEHGLENQSAIIVGLPSNTKPEGPYYNSMLALGTGKGRYDKTRLVPFGEYVPFENLIRGLNNFFDLPMSSFSLGNKSQLPLAVKDIRIATAICYEIAYPDLVARNSRNNNILLTVSNDAWFGDSIAPHQHMQMAKMRAIEAAKPLLRGTNNGITALVDHKGLTQQQLAQFESSVLQTTIRPREGNSLFTQWGSWPIISLCLLTLLFLICNSLKHKRMENL